MTLRDIGLPSVDDVVPVLTLPEDETHRHPRDFMVAMGRSFEQRITVPLPPEQVAPLVQQALATVPKANGIYLNPPTITASTGIGAFSWGEKLLVHLSRVPDGTEVMVRSECAFPLQLVDYGKNRKNVEQILRALPGQPTS